MKLMNIANAGLRLLVSPITGVLAAYKEADSRPKAENWKQFIWNDVKDYFLPLTGAIKGVRNELKREDK